MKNKLALLTALMAFPLVACNGNPSSSSNYEGDGSKEGSVSGSTSGSSIPVDISSDSQAPAEPTSVEIVWADYCDDGEELGLFEGDGLSIEFGIGEGRNEPKFYANGNDARMYQGNTLTISAANITKIEFTLNDKAGEFSANPGQLSENLWTGDTDEVVFTVTSGQRRIVSMKIDYTPGEGQPQLEFDTADEYVLYFLEYRGVTSYQAAPGISGIEKEKFIDAEYELEPYESLFGLAPAYVSVYFEAGTLDPILDKLESEGFDVPAEVSEWGTFDCVDDTLEIDVMEFDDSWVEYGIPEGTVSVTYYLLADLDEIGGDTLEFESAAECVMYFLECREISGFETVPVISGLSDEDLLYMDYDMEGLDGYAPYVELDYAPSTKDAIFAALESEGFDVPETPDSLYGYECTKGELEVDVYILDADDASLYQMDEGVVTLTFYAIADISE